MCAVDVEARTRCCPSPLRRLPCCPSVFGCRWRPRFSRRSGSLCTGTTPRYFAIYISSCCARTQQGALRLDCESRFDDDRPKACPRRWRSPAPPVSPLYELMSGYLCHGGNPTPIDHLCASSDDAHLVAGRALGRRMPKACPRLPRPSLSSRPLSYAFISFNLLSAWFLAMGARSEVVRVRLGQPSRLRCLPFAMSRPFSSACASLWTPIKVLFVFSSVSSPSMVVGASASSLAVFLLWCHSSG